MPPPQQSLDCASLVSPWLPGELLGPLGLLRAPHTGTEGHASGPARSPMAEMGCREDPGSVRRGGPGALVTEAQDRP